MNLSHPVVDLCIVCSNFEESLTFYRDKLGFEVVLDIDIPEDLATGLGWHRKASDRCACRREKR